MNISVGSIAGSRAWAAGIVVFGGLALGAGNSAQAASFTNGSFELGTDPGSFSTVFQGDGATITGWLVGGPSGASVDYIGSYWEAADGSRSVDLSGTSDYPDGLIKWGEISQTFDTISGQTYRVSLSSRETLMELLKQRSLMRKPVPFQGRSTTILSQMERPGLHQWGGCWHRLTSPPSAIQQRSPLEATRQIIIHISDLPSTT